MHEQKLNYLRELIIEKYTVRMIILDETGFRHMPIQFDEEDSLRIAPFRIVLIILVFKK